MLFKVSVSLTDFLSEWPVLWCIWGVKVPYYYCITVNFSLYICWYLFYVFRCAYAGCTYAYSCYIFVDWSFDHFVGNFFVSWNSLWFKDHFVRYKYCQPGFPLISICVEYLSHPLTLSLCVSLSLKWPLVDSLYVGLAFIAIQPVCAFGWSI